MSGPVFSCGHPRYGYNRLIFKNGSAGTGERCRSCHNGFQRDRAAAGRGALLLVIALHLEGVLSEGQIAAATGLGRSVVRRLADEQRNSLPTPQVVE